MSGILSPKPAARNKHGLFRLTTAALLAFSFLATPEMPLFEGRASAQATAAQDTLLSGAESAAVSKALSAIKQGRWSAAEQAIAATHDPLAAKIFYWLSYTEKGGAVPFNRISAFIRQNPDWPRRGKLALEAEKAMPASLSDEDVVRWFDDYKPQTSEGMDRYVKALVRNGGTKKAGQALEAWWPNAQLSTPQQKYFLSHYGDMIDKDVHIGRFGASIQKKQYTNARAMAQYLGNGYSALVEARIALSEGRANVSASVAHVPAHLQDDPGLLYERLRWRRRNNQDFGAIEILHNMPPVAQISNPDDWWTERNIMVRRMIENKQYESAYLLAAGHGMKEGGPSFAEAEFLAGWLALRFLDKPGDAFNHFEALYKRSNTPISRARGAYWAGQASETLKSPDIAKQWYRHAAYHQTTFYGQMALAKLDDADKPPQQLPPEVTLGGDIAFKSKEMVQVTRLFANAGMREETNSFLDALAQSVKTGEDYALVARLAEDMGYEHKAVRIAKDGLVRGYLLSDQLYPTSLNNIKQAKQEWALVHALIRQESQFDPRATSPVGARGLMQIMPATAKEVARHNRQPYSADRLYDPGYNIRIGDLYLNQLLKQYDGSYALALAAYNGGPGNVSKWLKQFGDPRKGDISMIDWIELIPISETRNYVQRVLEGVYIYRTKLQGVQQSYNAPIHVAMKDPQP